MTELRTVTLTGGPFHGGYWSMECASHRLDLPHRESDGEWYVYTYETIPEDNAVMAFCGKRPSITSP